VSQWRDKVKAALRKPEVLRGISAIAAEWMEEHIAENVGRGANGLPVPHKPLKAVSSGVWVSRKPKSGGFTATRKKQVQVLRHNREKTKSWIVTTQRTQYFIPSMSYRTGGQPLRDTGSLARSVGASATNNGSRLRLTMHGNKYGLYQDRGFKTNGPNYIPLTKKGKRNHGTGQNPNQEGLVRGKDFKMAWKGVRVPARPFILPTKQDMITFGRSIYLGLKAVLKGT
jgi:hypothetical protein